MEHPARDERSAAAHDVHYAPLALHPGDCGTRYTAVQCQEVCAVLRLLLNHMKKILVCHLDHCTVLLDCDHRRLIEWNRADHNRRVLNNAPARHVDVVPCREIHYGVCAAADGFIQFLQLRCNRREHIRGADVRVHLDAETRANAACASFRMPYVCRDCNSSRRHPRAHELRCHMLLLRHKVHFLCQLSCTCTLHLCRHNNRLLKQISRPA